MADRSLYCAGCKKHMALLRDARVRTGMVVYCAVCNEGLVRREKPKDTHSDIPDFLSALFKGKK